MCPRFDPWIGYLNQYQLKSSALMPSWEDMAADRSSWREIPRLKAGEEQIQTWAEEKRARRKAGTSEVDPADSIRTV